MSEIEKSFYSKASMYSFVVVMILIFLMWVGTGQFSHVDMMLFGYLISSFVFAIGMTIRLCAWAVRPATHQVLKRSFSNMKKKKRVKRNWRAIAKTAFDNIILQKFIFKRGIYRGIMHWLIAWGCIGSFAITFGLTFGWMHFKLIDPETYQIVVMGIPTISMAANGIFAELVYNGLNITAMMVLIGVTMALIRRSKNQDVKVTQRVEFDLFPLYILLWVTVSGLILTVSYKFLGGWMHNYLALIHQITVVIFLVYFPFGKLFHLPVRPLATAVPMNYQEVVGVDTRKCKSCQSPYSNDDQINDVKEILGVQSFDLQLADGSYLADYCPSCRRRIRVMKQLNINSNLPSPNGPIQTNNGIHIPGFGQKRDDSYYEKMGDE
ncbi:MFS transporter [Halalkalibacter alkaliphilus]|uniref:MFS transporter n=1 Tax=Halalkalibacter alkaliphilus TaxID=2917993 RepID=A0A9X2I9E5_9BACI|nr:MFS transporter [Halalkalibacter alkaliphilus]MCL7748705.1 MFS transporter [Halalkalibacter alkaliphilus]